MSTIHERLKAVRLNVAKLNQLKFGESLGLGQTVVSDYEKGITKSIKPEILIKVCELYNINMEWLQTGSGLMQGTVEDTPVKDDIGGYSLNNAYISNKNPNTVAVPFYSAKASAGKGLILEDYVDKDVMFFDKRWLINIIGVNPHNVSLITASGDSMTSGQNLKDDINNGDLLLIDNSIKEVINGKIFVISYNGNLLVKKCLKDFNGKVSLLSNNPKYTPIVLNTYDDSEIIGRVVWNGSRETV